MGSRPRAFQREIDEVRTLPLTPQRVAQKSEFVIICCATTLLAIQIAVLATAIPSVRHRLVLYP